MKNISESATHCLPVFIVHYSVNSKLFHSYYGGSVKAKLGVAVWTHCDTSV